MFHTFSWVVCKVYNFHDFFCDHPLWCFFSYAPHYGVFSFFLTKMTPTVVFFFTKISPTVVFFFLTRRVSHCGVFFSYAEGLPPWCFFFLTPHCSVFFLTKMTSHCGVFFSYAPLWCFFSYAGPTVVFFFLTRSPLWCFFFLRGPHCGVFFLTRSL